MATTKNSYEPEMGDCRMVIRTSEATCYVMDTLCRDVTVKERKKIDADIIRMYRQAVLRQKEVDSGDS